MKEYLSNAIAFMLVYGGLTLLGLKFIFDEPIIWSHILVESVLGGILYAGVLRFWNRRKAQKQEDHQ